MKNPFDNIKRLKFGLEMIKNYHEPPRFKKSYVPNWVKAGNNFKVHEGVMFTQGFGFVRDSAGTWLHIPHVGKVIIGEDVEIFPGTTINRGTVDDTIIGSGTKIDHHCHIGHNSKIGRKCIICAGTIIAGSVVIGDNVWIGPNSTIKNKIVIPNNTYIGCQSNVVKSPSKSGLMIYGNPAKEYEKEYLPHNKVG